MKRRYQVFVSSTYEDLKEERQVVMQTLLELECIPAGMELFPAANEDQWTIIEKVVKECDYYIVIVAGRYGSIHPSGISYTEKEYQYAVNNNIPTLCFLHENPDELPEEKKESEESEARAKLKAFRDHLKNSKQVRHYSSSDGLGRIVSTSLSAIKEEHPGVGWVKADEMPDEATSAEILRLHGQIEELQEELQSTSYEAPEGTDRYAQGKDTFNITFSFTTATHEEAWEDIGTSYKGKISLEWDRIFAVVSPLLIDEESEFGIRQILNAYAHSSVERQVENDSQVAGDIYNFSINNDDFHTIIVQLKALGLIMRSPKKHPPSDSTTYWSLTPYGDNVMSRLRAIRKGGITILDMPIPAISYEGV